MCSAEHESAPHQFPKSPEPLRASATPAKLVACSKCFWLLGADIGRCAFKAFGKVLALLQGELLMPFLECKMRAKTSSGSVSGRCKAFSQEML